MVLAGNNVQSSKISFKTHIYMYIHALTYTHTDTLIHIQRHTHIHTERKRDLHALDR